LKLPCELIKLKGASYGKITISSNSMYFESNGEKRPKPGKNT